MKDTTSASCCAPSSPGASSRLPAWATRQRLMIVAGTAVVLSGIAFNWGWLTALGLAPLLLMLVPCGVMCAAGMCMKAGPKTTPTNSEPPISAPK